MSSTSNTGANTGPAQSGAGDKVKSAIGAVHGAGEAIRGTVNQGVDEAFGSKEGAAKNEAISARGFESMDDGKLRRADREEAKLGRATETDIAHTSKNI